MHYNLSLKYQAEEFLNINDLVTEVWDGIAASIMYDTCEAVGNDVDNLLERTKIGFITFLTYNQVLAMTYGINLNDVPIISMRMDSKPIMELDYSLISQETIDEIGVVSNPNILVLARFGISAAWRNKGIGEQVLKGVIKQTKGKYGYMLITESKPAQLEKHEVGKSLYNMQGVEWTGLEEDPENAQQRLNAFWQRCGFKPFKNYDNVFICNVEKTVPELLKAKEPAV